MRNTYFKFKQFTVFHDKCAMKVGTDGVLLGVWCGIESATRILDVGTGSGLIALIMAQRNPQAYITAIDVDAGAVQQAAINFEMSPFSEQLTVRHTSFSDFACLTTEKFDSIVCNPPFFSRSLLPSDVQRAHARHSISLTFEQLLKFGKQLMEKNGTLSLIVPFDKDVEIAKLMEKYEWHLLRKTVVLPTPGTRAKRVLLCLSPVFEREKEENTLIIEQSRHVYTAEFRLLTHEFYLDV